MTSGKEKISAIALIAVLSLLYNFSYLNDSPSHIHAWAQADRLALTHGFVENDLNFFKPQTYIYNHQFPDWWMQPSEQAITAVDFPIHDYIPAVLMKVIGNTDPVVFRGYVLLYSIIGLFFLFRLARDITRNFAASLLVVVFAATSPVFVYYQGNFLPTIPSLANAMIGIFFYHRYIRNQDLRSFWWGVGFLTLAALARTTFAIPIIAIAGVEFLRFLRRETPLFPKVIPLIISLLTILSYQLYNSYLRNEYGSHFLSSFMPPSDWNEALEIMSATLDNWGWQYFSVWHYLVFAMVFLLAFYSAIKYRPKSKVFRNPFILFTATYLFGCMCFTVLMFRQFPAHDYYFLDTYFLAMLLVLMLMIKGTLGFRWIRNGKLAKLSMLLIAAALVLVPFDSQENRYTTDINDKTAATIRNYEGSAGFLDSLGIARDARLLVIDAVAPNLPFLHMERKGYAVMMPTTENISEAMKWDYDYVVVQNEFFIPVVYRNYPQFIDEVSIVGSNGRILVGRRQQNTITDLAGFLGLTDERLILHAKQNFEKKPGSEWENIKLAEELVFSGSSSGVITPDMEYGLTYKSRDMHQLSGQSATLFLSGFFQVRGEANAEWVVAVSSAGETLFYQSYPLNERLKVGDQWVKDSLVFILPEVDAPDLELAVYIWNTGGAELYYDEIDLRIYR